MLQNFFRGRDGSRLVAVMGLILAGSLTAGVEGRAAETGSLHMSCTNPTGGATWAIVVDLDHGSVDALPATISSKWISWHDPKQGYLDLERATGKLQVRNVSTTGGYFLHYVCKPE
jgi:hypothetical protein